MATIPISSFDLARFVETIVDFWNDSEVAFPLIHNGFADFGVPCLEDDFDNVGSGPVEWLKHGLTLFGQFTRGDGINYDCADGTQIEVPDEDSDVIDQTYLDDCSTYGFLIALKGEILTINPAVLRDITGECRVEALHDAGFFDTIMAKFIESFRQ